MAYRILAVTGVPCAGKTELCGRLGPRLGAKVMGLNELIERESLWSGYDKERDTRMVDTGLLGRRVAGMIESDTILDGLLSHLLGVTHVLVLRCDPRVLRLRMLSRGYGRAKIMENLEAEYSGVILAESLSRCGNVLEADNTRGADLDAIAEWWETGGKRVFDADWTAEFEETLRNAGSAPTL
jgi:adenylate kinase